MTPTEFLQNRNIVAEDKTDLIIGFDNGTNESLIDLLEKYHQAKLKLLGIADVVGQREHLKVFADYAQKRMWEDDSKDLSEFVDEFESL